MNFLIRILVFSFISGLTTASIAYAAIESSPADATVMVNCRYRDPAKDPILFRDTPSGWQGLPLGAGQIHPLFPAKDIEPDCARIVERLFANRGELRDLGLGTYELRLETVAAARALMSEYRNNCASALRDDEGDYVIEVLPNGSAYYPSQMTI